MPAPFSIVTFTDADGDEFPVRVPVLFDCSTRDQIITEARHIAREQIEAGDIAPELPLRIAGMSGCWDINGRFLGMVERITGKGKQ